MNRTGAGPVHFDDAARLADAIVERVGKTIVLALPLGLGKANHIANALYARAVADRSIKLTIFTGLTLGAAEAEGRSGAPLRRAVRAARVRRIPGAGLRHGDPRRHRAGQRHRQRVLLRGRAMARLALRAAALHLGELHPRARAACSTAASTSWRNWSRIARADSAHPFSLSCNPDLTVDLLALRRAGRADFLFCGETNSELPFMGGDAAIGAGEFDLLLDNPALDFPLFAPPREPIAPADYAAGLHAATIVPDGGTLQIGIGSLGDAVTQGLILRHRNNADFRSLIGRLRPEGSPPAASHVSPFAAGLYGCTEMFVEGLLDLYRAGILKREVDGALLHAGFFVGSRAFYRALREMPRGGRGQIPDDVDLLRQRALPR